jgi:hypothetical protein
MSSLKRVKFLERRFGTGAICGRRPRGEPVRILPSAVSGTDRTIPDRSCCSPHQWRSYRARESRPGVPPLQRDQVGSHGRPGSDDRFDRPFVQSPNRVLAAALSMGGVRSLPYRGSFGIRTSHDSSPPVEPPRHGRDPSPIGGVGVIYRDRPMTRFRARLNGTIPPGPGKAAMLPPARCLDVQSYKEKVSRLIDRWTCLLSPPVK